MGDFEKLIKEAVAEGVQTAMEEYLGKLPPDILTIEEAAKILKVDGETVRRYCRVGDLRFHQVGKFIRIEMRHLNEYLAKNEM